MFYGLFICQRISTSFDFDFFLNAKVFYRNYFKIRNNNEKIDFD